MKNISLFLLQIIILFSCNKSSNPETTNTKTTNYLSMKINGNQWVADHDIFGAFHPSGYNKAVIIAGAKGPKTATEQVFNLNLYNIDQPGTFTIDQNNTNYSVVQLANLDKDDFLCGGAALNYKMTVIIKTLNKNPALVEATFAGEIQCNTSQVIKITEGKFYYQE